MRNTLLVLSTLLAASLAVVTLPENLFFYTKLESTTPTDETGRLAAASAVGAPAVVPGYDGNGIRFNPATVTVATDAINFPELPIDGPVTYTAWIYIESASEFGKAISNKVDFDDVLGNDIEISFPTGTSQLTFVSGNKQVSQLPYTWAFNTWYHIAVVGAADGATLYVNGTALGAKGTVSAVAVANSGKPFSIGSSTNKAGDINPGGAFRGIIDEVRVYNTTLTAAQVALVFGETFGIESSTSTSESSTSASDSSSDTSSSGSTTVSTVATSVVPSTTRNNNASSAVVSLFVVICSFLFMF